MSPEHDRLPAPKINMRNIVKIYDSPKLICINKFFRRSIVRRKHNVFSRNFKSFRHHKFCIGRAVATATILFQNIDQKRVWRSFYRKVFFVTLVPWKRLFKRFYIFSDSFFIIKMKRSRIYFVIFSTFSFVTNGLLSIFSHSSYFYLQPDSYFCFYILFHSCNSHHITCGASLFFTFGEGIPAVITTISPVSTNCFTFASSIALSQMSSVVLNACDLIGFTPQ